MRSSSNSVLIVGLGFVGLACYAGFKKLGIETYGFEKNPTRLREIRNLDGHWIEPEVKDFLAGCDDLEETTLGDINSELLNQRVICLLCVGTPEAPDGGADLSILKSAILDLLQALKGKTLELVVKSTVPPGTLEQLKEFVWSVNSENKVLLVSNPEFLREGMAFDDFCNPDRIMIGCDTADELELENIYRQHFNNVFRTTTSTAEFSKYFSNTALAAMISFSNDMRLFANQLNGVDSAIVFQQFQLDRRWSSNSMKSYFWPGIGFGGYCLPKDTAALLRCMNLHSYEGHCVKALIAVNNHLIEHFGTLIIDKFKNKRRIIFCGSSFKVGSDDIRHSKTLEVVRYIESKTQASLALLEDPAALEIVASYPSLEVIDEADLTAEDGIVVMLKDEKYRDILNKFQTQNVINVPLL